MKTFYSLLFESAEDRIEEARESPTYFVDLNLDQIINAITSGKEEYNLKPLFYTPLKNSDTIAYRHEIMQDLENRSLFESIKSFAKRMREMRQHLALADKSDFLYQKERWFLDAVEIYCDAIGCLARDLSLADLKSRGFAAFRDYLAYYARSESFASLLEQTTRLKADLSAVKYCVQIKDGGFKVRRYESETDYSVEVEATFAKFRQGEVKDYRIAFLSSSPPMSHIGEKILEFVARLYPEEFSRLDSYYTANSRFLEEAIASFDREVQFYVAYLEYIALFKRAGLKLCYPEMSRDKEVYDYEGFDLALARKLLTEGAPVVCNDFYLQGKERIFVVSGPNQGGKTTFARTFGQLHYLACLGLLVSGREARLFLFDSLFTHFEREESIENLRGKLEDDLIRIHTILDRATSGSILIMNEIFTSTTLQDAVFLSKKVLEEVIRRDMLCVCVTFLDELASLSENTVSMVSTVVPENPAMRTYKVVRRPADGLAYALSIAEKYRLTYDCLKERIAS